VGHSCQCLLSKILRADWLINSTSRRLFGRYARPRSRLDCIRKFNCGGAQLLVYCTANGGWRLCAVGHARLCYYHLRTCVWAGSNKKLQKFGVDLTRSALRRKSIIGNYHRAASFDQLSGAWRRDCFAALASDGTKRKISRSPVRFRVSTGVILYTLPRRKKIAPQKWGL